MAVEPLRPIRQVTSTSHGMARLPELRRAKQDARFGSPNPVTTEKHLVPSDLLGKIRPVHVGAVACRCSLIAKESCGCCIDPQLKIFTAIFTYSHRKIMGAVSRVETCTPGRSTLAR